LLGNRAYWLFAGLVLVLLGGCAGLRDSVIDQAAGFPASHVISGVRETSAEYKEEQHQERAEALSSEYEAFLKEKEAADKAQEDNSRSIMLEQKEPQVELPKPETSTDL